MKIIFVIPNISSGGAERVISILSNSFAKKSIEVDILLLQDKKIFYEISDNVNIVFFDIDLLSCTKKLACKILRDYFKAQKKAHDKVIVIPFLDTCLKRVLASTIGLGLPVFACERNNPYQNGESVISRIKANIPYMLASRCIFQTPDAKNYYCRRVRKKGYIIMNPLVMPEEVCWKGQKSKRIVSVGRLEPQKNQLLLIDAFSKIHKEYPEYILEIYGEGTLKGDLMLRINELGLDTAVYLCGNSANIYKILAESLMFVLPSDFEGLSNALIEALAIGMPVVTTDHPCGGARMLVKDGENGILVPIKDEAALASAMERVIEDQVFATEIGRHAYEVRGTVSVPQITKEWLEIIERM